MQRQTAEHARRQLRWLGRLTGVPAALLLLVVSAPAQTDAVLPPIGGQGGRQFNARCPQGRHLAGFELLVGDVVDAIRPLCVAAYGPAEAGPVEPYPSSFGGPERDATMTRLLGVWKSSRSSARRMRPS